MGLLDSVLGNVLGSNHPNSSVLGPILNSVLGGQGGVGGLVEKMNQAGMGDVVNSWVGNGPNKPIDPGQLGQVLGHDNVDQWSQQSGMPHGSILSELSKMLPNAVDHMTPNGQVPSGSSGGGGTSPFDEAGLELPNR